MDALSSAGSMQLRHGFRHLDDGVLIARNNAHPCLSAAWANASLPISSFFVICFPASKPGFRECSSLFHVKQRRENRLDTCS